MTAFRSVPLALTIPLAALAAVAAGAGVLVDDLYSRDLESFAVQAAAQDWVTLLVAVPAVLGLAWAAWRGSRAALLVWHGAVGYLAYTYAIASFMVQFNPLFLVYTSTFGLAFLALATSLATTIRDTPARAFGPAWPRRTVAGVLWACVAVFAFLWLSDIVPALLDGTTPGTLAESGTPTNGVEVLDLAILLPTVALTGAWVLARRVRGYVIATAFLGFVTLLALALAAMVVGLAAEELAVSAAPAAILGALAGLAVVLAVRAARATSDATAPAPTLEEMA